MAFLRVQANGKGNLSRVVKEKREQSGFGYQNDLELIVIYGLTLFSYGFVAPWGQILCQIHLTLPHKIWLE